MITPESFSNRVLERNGQLGKDACRILAAALQSVDPYKCVLNQLKFEKNGFSIGEEHFTLQEFDRISLIGFGKAAVPMGKAVLDCFHEKNIGYARVITKAPKFLSEAGYQNKLTIEIGGHPVPNEGSIRATCKMLEGLPEFTSRDLVFVVISGGGSALFTSPMGQVSLEDLQDMTSLLLRSGADIQEINTLRKHIDGVKGGRLAALLSPACVHTLILSDVIGDRLDMIASGPTVADPTTFAVAWEILKKYHLLKKIPRTIYSLLENGLKGKVSETLKDKDFKNKRIFNHLVGTNKIAAQAAHEEAERLGYNSRVVTNTLTGLTPDVAARLCSDLLAENKTEKPYCRIYGGEPTVNVVGNGLGGRNQDLVLHMVQGLQHLKHLLLISLATDGEDGPTDAAGAASDAIVFDDGTELFLNLTTYIITNNAYEYLDKVGALIKTGPTGTNVNDLVLIMAGRDNN